MIGWLLAQHAVAAALEHSSMHTFPQGPGHISDQAWLQALRMAAEQLGAASRPLFQDPAPQPAGHVPHFQAPVPPGRSAGAWAPSGQARSQPSRPQDQQVPPHHQTGSQGQPVLQQLSSYPSFPHMPAAPSVLPLLSQDGGSPAVQPATSQEVSLADLLHRTQQQ